MIDNIHAELVIHGGNIITIDSRRPRAKAVAVQFGKIMAVGQDEEMKPLIGKDTKVVDVAGKTVIPGLIDAHCHGMWAGQAAFQIDCGPNAVSSIADIKRAIAKRAKITPKGEWILSCGYDDTKIAEGRLLNRNELDEVAPHHPVWIHHVSCHIAVLNSLGLKAANLNKDSLDPVGGRFGRDPYTGELDGTAFEAGHDIFIYGREPIIPHPKPEQYREAIKCMCRQANSVGLTSIGEALCDPTIFQAFQTALSRGELSIRVYMLMFVDYLDDMINAGLKTGFGNNQLRLGGIKVIGDGAISGRTAYLSEPYVGSKDDYGIMVTPPDELNEQVMAAHRAGFQVAVHANGDKYISLTLDAYERALKEYPQRNHRHRLEHCTMVNPELLARIKRLGVVAIPFGPYIYYHGEKMGFYGPERLRMMFAHRSFLDASIPVAGSSDHPCAPWFPLTGIQSCVTRKSHTGEVLGPEQRISAEEALRIYTLGGSYASFEENMKGSIEVGKLADMVILGEDITKVESESIKDVPVIATIVGGEFVYENW